MSIDSLFNKPSIHPKTKLNYLVLRQKILKLINEDNSQNLSELNTSFKKYLQFNSAILTQNQYLNFVNSLEKQYNFIISENIAHNRYSDLFEMSTALKKQFLNKYLEITSENLNENDAERIKKIIVFKKYLNSENFQNTKADSLFKDILLQIPNNQSRYSKNISMSGIDIMRVWSDSSYKYFANIKDNNNFSFVFLCNETDLKKIVTTNFDSQIWDNQATELLKKYFYSPLKKHIKPHINYISMDGLFNFLPINGVKIAKNKYLIDEIGFVNISTFNDTESPNYAAKTDRFQIFYGINYSSNMSNALDQNSKLTYNSKNLKREIYENIWPKLPNSVVEGKKIINTLNSAGFKTDSLCCDNASEANVKNKLKASPEFLHFATHGFYFGNYKEDSSYLSKSRKKEGLVFAGANGLEWEFGNEITPNDGILTANEIANLNLQNTKLVVLSACQTALGEVKGNEGVFGLQRAFKMAGVEYIIASLWKVPDAETAEMMIMFYENLAKKESIEDAFRNAQLKMRKKYPPYYWAGFVLTR